VLLIEATFEKQWFQSAVDIGDYRATGHHHTGFDV
jgi:hypothetical protein